MHSHSKTSAWNQSITPVDILHTAISKGTGFLTGRNTSSIPVGGIIETLSLIDRELLGRLRSDDISPDKLINPYLGMPPYQSTITTLKAEFDAKCKWTATRQKHYE